MTFSGHLRLRADAREDGRTRLAEQSFRAPYHVSKPYWDGSALLVQVVNPTAGILSGDALELDVQVDAGAALLLTMPSASRVFRMPNGSALSRQYFRIGAGAWFELWPEPLVPHVQSVFRQHTRVTAERGAVFFFGETLLPGRLARGEAWAWTRLTLDFELTIGGELVLRERFDQSGAELRRMAVLAQRDDSCAFANLVVGSEGLKDTTWCERIHALQSDQLSIGVTRLRGDYPAYSIKAIAADGQALRDGLRAVREILKPILPKLASDPRKL